MAVADAGADLYIYDDIGKSWMGDETVTAKQFVADLAALPASVKAIRVHVNSMGGDVFDALAIANALRAQRTTKGRTVEMTVDGIAASAASVVLMAGSPIKIADNALIMIHDPFTLGMGNAEDMRRLADDLDTVRDAIVATYKWQVPLSEDEIKALMDAETWMDADAAIKNGFATTKIKGLKAAASISQQAFGQYQIPEQYRARVLALGAPAGASAQLLPRPGVSGVPAIAASGRKDAHTMKTTAEQMAEFQASKSAKIARMNELRGTADGTTMSAEQQTEFDALMTDVDSITGDLSRLERLEALNRSQAVPVAGATPAAASAARSGVVTVKDNTPAGIKFARYAMCLAAAKGNTSQAREIALARYPHEANLHAILNAAVAAGTTTDPTWAGPLVQYQEYAGDFVEFLRPQTIIGKFGTGSIPSLRRVPFNIRIKGQISGGSGYWVGQGQAKPVTKIDFNDITMRWAKVANIAVISEELARFSSPSAEALVRDALAGALIERLDTDFVDPLKAEVPDISPASITYNVSGINSAGNTAEKVRADIKSVFAPFIEANLTPAQGVWIMSATTALALSLMRNDLGQPEFPGITMTGGTFEGLPVIVSQYVSSLTSPANNIVVLVNASDVYLADDGQVVIDVSREASLEMDSAPSGASSDGGSPASAQAAQLVSLWQTNSVGVRAERFINWKKRRDAAVQYLYDVNWGS